MRLTNVSIKKYKSIEEPQSFEVDPTTTILVGMNESGKTSILECLASSCITLVDIPFSLKLVMNVLLPLWLLACWILASLYKFRNRFCIV